MKIRGRYLLAHLVLPFSRTEFFGWGRLAHMLGTFDFQAEKAWRGLSTTMRGKWHGYLMTLDLLDWAQRCTWLMGRYYELDTQLVIRAMVRPGDTFIDVGANIGMISLLASHLVGFHGRVLSFEPNPNPCTILRQTVGMNRIDNIEIFEVALSDRVERKTLTVLGRHDGEGTLADIPESNAATQRHITETVVGDEILPDNLPGRVFIKVDIEGYELHAIQGLRDFIRRRRPLILTEFEPKHLMRAGTSPRELISLMRDQGYVGFDIVVKRAPIRFKYRLEPLGGDEARGLNVLWIHRDAIGRKQHGYAPEGVKAPELSGGPDPVSP